jgi:hypothetical protein
MEFGRTGGVGVDHGVGWEEGFAVLVELSGAEGSAGFPEEVGDALDGLVLQRMLDALGEFGEAVAHLFNLFRRWLQIIPYSTPRLDHRLSGQLFGCPAVEADEIILGVIGEAVPVQEIEGFVPEAPETEVEGAEPYFLRNVGEVVFGCFVLLFLIFDF